MAGAVALRHTAARYPVLEWIMTLALPTNPSLLAHLAILPDPRLDRTKRHKLLDILTIAICAVLGGAEGWNEIAAFGEAKQEWFKRFLELPNGIPSHDTFGRVFARLDPQALAGAFSGWAQAVSQCLAGWVAVDGKRPRGVQRAGEALHLVSAWAGATRLVLGQVPTAAKSNEITAIPELLKLLELKGCIVSTDAQGCQKSIAAGIRERGGDYVLALKSNHPNLLHEVQAVWEIRLGNAFAHHPYSYSETAEEGHGRQETRRYWLTPVPAWLKEDTAEWPDLNCLGLVQSERRIGGKLQQQNRYYLTSLPCQAQPFAEAVRGHWGIENQVHWCLDVTFREDASRVRKDHAPANLGVIRRMALNLLRQDPSPGSLRLKQRKAGWDESYLIKLLKGQLL